MDYQPFKTLIELKKYDRALHFLHRYEALHPQDADIAFMLGEVYDRTDNLFEAERYYNKAITLDPKKLLAYTNLESVLREQTRNTECLDILQKVRELAPHLDNVIKTSESMLTLTSGDLSGFQGYENRFHFKALKDAYEKPFFTRWKKGQDLKGKTVLLRYEQGLGDTIQFARYANVLKALGAKKVSVLCKKTLHTLLRTIKGVSETFDTLPAEAHFDFEVMMMSMPAILETTRDEDIPGNPYLKVNPQDAKIWLDRMQPTGKLKVGLVWCGEMKKHLGWLAERMNRRRSIPLEQLRPILDVDCDFYSLQKGEKEQDLVDFVAAHPIKNPMIEVKDFYDTACIIHNLDLVIAVDTSTAHLAGALGKKTWMLTRLDGDWRWMSNRSDTPWYPSMELFRQTTFAEWRPLINVVAARLKELSNEG